MPSLCQWVMVNSYLSWRRSEMETAVTMMLVRAIALSRSYIMGRVWKLTCTS